MEIIRRPFEYLFTWLGLLFFAVLLVSSGIAIRVISWLVPVKNCRVIAQAGISRMFRLYLWTMQTLGWIKADLSALHALKHQGPVLVAPNHPCLLDAVLLLAAMPRGVCLMKPALLSNPLYGFGARAAGYIAADKAIPMVQSVRQALAQGEQLLYFPEGTRTVTAPTNPISGAFALIAKRLGYPIQVVYIETDSLFLSKDWPLWRAPRLPVHYKVVLGPSLQLADNASEAATSSYGRDVSMQIEQLYRDHFDTKTAQNAEHRHVG